MSAPRNVLNYEKHFFFGGGNTAKITKIYACFTVDLHYLYVPFKIKAQILKKKTYQRLLS